MFATAGYAEIGYSLADKAWAPSISYRLGYFSGDDDPYTETYERWTALLRR